MAANHSRKKNFFKYQFFVDSVEITFRLKTYFFRDFIKKVFPKKVIPKRFRKRFQN